MVEENVYYRYVGEHSQRQVHLGESRVVRTLNFVKREGRRWEKGERRIRQQVGSQRYKKV